MHNNLLYYLVDQAIRCEDKIEITSIKVKTTQHLNYIEEHYKIDEEQDLDFLDTICKAYAILGKNDKSERLAHQIIEIFLDGKSKSLNEEDAANIAREARQLLKTIKS